MAKRPLGEKYEFELFFGLGATLTEEQDAMIQSIFDHKITFVDSKAGTGKTTIAIATAKQINAVLGKEAVYICAPINMKVLGYLPGDLNEKLAVYQQPLVDALFAINENPMQAIFHEEIDDYSNKNINDYAWIHFESPTFYRGINLKNKTVILDEAQNFTKADIKKILTRCSDDCKVIVIGHQMQCDLNNQSDSGFKPYMDWFETFDDVGYVTLTKNFRGTLSTHADNMPL